MLDGITFIPPLTILAAQMRDVATDLQDFEEPLKTSVQQVAIPAIGRNFDLEGPGWDPLSEATVLIRGESNPILDRTGALRAAATSTDIWNITSTEAVVTNLDADVHYGQFHLSGTQYMPQREFLFFTPEDEGRIAQVFADWMSDTVAEGGY